MIKQDAHVFRAPILGLLLAPICTVVLGIGLIKVEQSPFTFAIAVFVFLFLLAANFWLPFYTVEISPKKVSVKIDLWLGKKFTIKERHMPLSSVVKATEVKQFLFFPNVIYIISNHEVITVQYISNYNKFVNLLGNYIGKRKLCPDLREYLD